MALGENRTSSHPAEDQIPAAMPQPPFEQVTTLTLTDGPDSIRSCWPMTDVTNVYQSSPAVYNIRTHSRLNACLGGICDWLTRLYEPITEKYIYEKHISYVTFLCKNHLDWLSRGQFRHSKNTGGLPTQRWGYWGFDSICFLYFDQTSDNVFYSWSNTGL